MSRINCEICEDPSPNVYEPKTEGYYCRTCYDKFNPQILCDCDVSCPKCNIQYDQ